MSRSSTHDFRHTLRSLPVMFTALLAVVGAVDLFLLSQPKLLEHWSMELRHVLSVLPIAAPATQCWRRHWQLLA